MKNLNETFGHYVTPEGVKFVLTYPQELLKTSERKVATLLFANVRQFTPFTVAMQPERVMKAFNQIFACINDTVNQVGGPLNKFVEDAILVLFGAPVSNGDRYLSAAPAAVAS